VPDDGKHESVVTQIEISDPIAHTPSHLQFPGERVCQLEPFTAPRLLCLLQQPASRRPRLPA